MASLNPSLGVVMTALFATLVGALASEMTDEMAMIYLKKYHYMGDDNPDPRIAELSDKEGMKIGLMSFQRRNNLSDTGVLDEPTKALMSMPRCGLPDVITMEDTYMNMGEEEGSTRRKRYTLEGSKWSKYFLTYKITQYTPDLSQSAVDLEIRKAFAVWEMVTDLRFQQVAASQQADIVILFGAGNHGDPFPFDGPSGTLAHAFFPQYGGDSHFDEAERWTINTYSGINLFQVAAHEFGHALGLSHSNIQEALMAPFYRGYEPNFMLHSDDVQGIQAIYGSPTTTRRPPTPTTTTTTTPESEATSRRQGTPRVTTPRPATTTTTESANTDLADLCESGSFDTLTTVRDSDGNARLYVFRKDYYAEIGNGQVMPGYPKKISEGWPGLPNDLDAAIFWDATYNSYMVWNEESNSWTMVNKLQSKARTYFFKGSEYWRVSDGKLDDGYPRDIQSAWGLPSNLDAALVWSRNGRSYFFKGNRYYRYTRNQGRDRGYPRSISAWSEEFVGGVDGAITAGNSTYFMRDGDYYLYNDNRVAIADGYPRDSRIDILGCNRLQLAGSAGAESDLISGASSLTRVQSVLTSCLILVFTAFLV